MVAAFLLCGWLFTPAHAEKRVALVIGNSAYQAAPRLPNPASDARLMSDTLLSLSAFSWSAAALGDPEAKQNLREIRR
jgi:hypothetical protein